MTDHGRADRPWSEDGKTRAASNAAKLVIVIQATSSYVVVVEPKTTNWGNGLAAVTLRRSPARPRFVRTCTLRPPKCPRPHASAAPRSDDLAARALIDNQSSYLNDGARASISYQSAVFGGRRTAGVKMTATHFPYTPSHNINHVVIKFFL